jgi:Flp pilus assembly protein CpaB
VTFHVSIQDAAILDAARADGQLSIGLRNPNDKEAAAQLADSSASNLEPVQPASSVAPVKPKARKTVVKPAISKPMLFLRGNDSQLMTHSWTSGR